MYGAFDQTLHNYSKLRASTDVRNYANTAKVDKLVGLYSAVTENLQQAHDWLVHLALRSNRHDTPIEAVVVISCSVAELDDGQIQRSVR